MSTTAQEPETIQTLDIQKETLIAAPVEATWKAVLDELGPGSQMPDGTPFLMKIEAWPGGRWFRDHGSNTGHLWAHVQVIKPPPHEKPLLELSGPMFMSFPAVNFVQYRLVPEGGSTRLKITHRAMGLIPADHIEGMHEGWEHGLSRIKAVAEKRAAR
jgi:uncharacterized protein YndB with AHSA1/START domain